MHWPALFWFGDIKFALTTRPLVLREFQREQGAAKVGSKGAAAGVSAGKRADFQRRPYFISRPPKVDFDLFSSRPKFIPRLPRDSKRRTARSAVFIIALRKSRIFHFYANCSVSRF